MGGPGSCPDQISSVDISTLQLWICTHPVVQAACDLTRFGKNDTTRVPVLELVPQRTLQPFQLGILI